MKFLRNSTKFEYSLISIVFGNVHGLHIHTNINEIATVPSNTNNLSLFHQHKGKKKKTFFAHYKHIESYN